MVFRSRSYTLLAALCLVAISIFSYLVPEVFAEEVELFMQEVSYTTSDKVTIYGSWVVPQSQGEKHTKSPAVILLHDYGFDRRDWGIFIPDLVRQGYHVLAIDLRGHGKSTEGGNRLSESHSPLTRSYLLQVGYLDVQAALEWISRQKDTNPKNISVIGVGLGADLAYFCSGKFRKKIRTSVVISPSFAAVTDTNFVDATPRSVLFCASTKDANGSSMMAAESLSNFTNDPKRIVIYDSAAHGLVMFYKHPEIKQEILAWLRH
jgi:pimeloyl-ACP methyl ester carboxylesterase